jgi:hypothetical protein
MAKESQARAAMHGAHRWRRIGSWRRQRGENSAGKAAASRMANMAYASANVKSVNHVEKK